MILVLAVRTAALATKGPRAFACLALADSFISALDAPARYPIVTPWAVRYAISPRYHRNSEAADLYQKGQ